MVAFARQYDAAGQMTQMVAGGPDGAVDTRSDQATLYTYTRHGQIATTVYPDATPNTVTNTWYAGNDALDTVTDQKGVVTKHEYKAVAAGSDYNVESRQYVSTSGSTPDGGDQEVVTTIDGLGRVASVVTNDTHANGTQTSKVANAYKFCGALWKQQQQLGDGSGDVRTVEYGFDTCGKPEKLYWPYTSSAGDYVAYSNFDGLNRPLTIANNIDGDATTIVTYTFLGQRPAEKEYPQGTPSYTVRQTFWSASENNYDSYGRLLRSHAVGNPGGTPAELVDLNYLYDPAGNPTWRYDVLQNSGSTKWSQTYEHDVRNQLTKALQGERDGTWPSAPTMTSPQKTWVWNGTQGGNTYTLDKMGNWAKFYNNAVVDERTHNGVNEIETINSSSAHVSHDADGNMNKVPKPADPFNHHYACTYDFRNRLVKVETDDATPTKVAEYSYDGLNRRIRKIVYQSGGTTEDSDTRYLYDGQRVIEERNENDSHKLLARYIYGTLYIDEPVRMYRDGNGDGAFDNVADVNVYYLQDRLFNVVALTDLNGAVQERTWYECYGTPTCRDTNGNETTTSHFGNPYLFTGRELDAETSLYNYRARYYGAELGRFLGRDPIESDANLYRYVGDSPVSYADPLGYCPASPDASETGGGGDGNNECCCCVDDLVIKGLAKFTDVVSPEHFQMPRWGNEFTAVAKLENIKGSSGKCTLEWFECSSNETAWTAEAKIDHTKWHDSHKLFKNKVGNVTSEHWLDYEKGKKPFDSTQLGKFTIEAHDTPALPRFNSRELRIVIRVRSAPGCPCKETNKEKVVRITQTLTASGKPIGPDDNPLHALPGETWEAGEVKGDFPDPFAKKCGALPK